MDSNFRISRLAIFVFLLIFSLAFSCSTPSWFPIKKGPPHKAKTKELMDKEVILIDRQEYVRVVNPRSSEGSNQPKYLYVTVDEYLKNPGAYVPSVAPKEEPKKEFPLTTAASSPSVEKEIVSPSPLQSTSVSLKRKVVIAYIDDRTTSPDELLGDWIAQKLIKELDRKSQRILTVDYQAVKDFLEQRGLPLSDLEKPETLRLLNQVFGINALVSGVLSGPYVFTTKTARDPEGTASAIIRIEMKAVDTLSGKTIKAFSSNNPILAVKEKGSFSDEKAKIKAIDLTVTDLGAQLSRELEGLDWSCRIVKVDGEEIYLNAGKLTGLKIGDVLEVFQPDSPGKKKGLIRISSYLGVDASIGRSTDGQTPDTNDILRVAKLGSL